MIPAHLRARVDARLDDAGAALPGLGRAWLGDAVAGVAAEDAEVLRPLLVIAVAPWQMDEALQQAFAARLGDLALLQGLAWASFAAARRIGARLGGTIGTGTTTDGGG